MLIPNHNTDLWVLNINYYSADFAELTDDGLLNCFAPIVGWRQCADYLTPVSFTDIDNSDYIVLHKKTLQWWQPRYAEGVGIDSLQKRLK